MVVTGNGCGRKTVGHRERRPLIGFEGNLLGEHDVTWDKGPLRSKAPAFLGQTVLVEFIDVPSRSVSDAIPCSGMATDNFETADRVELSALSR